MQLLIYIAGFGALAFAACLFVVQAAAMELGLRLGRRRRRAAEVSRHAAAAVEGAGVVVGGILALLAFVLGLTLSFASGRYQERRDGVVAEANAIGSAWLRAHALGEPRGAEIARLLEAYIRTRIEFVEAPQDAAAAAGIDARSGALQAEIWGHAAAISRARPDAVVAGLLAALTEAFDRATAERLAFESSMPAQLVWLLLGMTVLAIGALGYQLGLRGRPQRAVTLLLIGMWTAVTTTILDLGAPRLGHIRVDPAPYRWTVEGFAGGVTIPPAPP